MDNRHRGKLSPAQARS